MSYDDYHLPGNHKPFGFTGIEEGVEDRFSTHLSPPIPYDPTNTTTLGITTTVTGPEPQTRGRSVSIGSRRISLSFSRNASVSPHPEPPSDVTTHERRASYDHRRDTQFEDYVARRASQRSSGVSLLQDDVKRALGEEFGFGELPTTTTTTINAKGERVISAGAVPAAHPSRPRVSSIGRQTSYEALVGGVGGGGTPISVTVTTPPEESPQLGHSLNSVPEAHEEDDLAHGARKKKKPAPRKRAVSESKVALLSDESEGEDGRTSPARIGRVEGLEDVELDAGGRGGRVNVM